LTRFRAMGNMAAQRQSAENQGQLPSSSHVRAIGDHATQERDIYDFSDVRIHKDSASAVRLGALAYTRGNDIHFAPDQYRPHTTEGKRLINHELGHVVQQRLGVVRPTTRISGLPVNDNPALERDANRLGEAIYSRHISTLINHKNKPRQEKRVLARNNVQKMPKADRIMTKRDQWIPPHSSATYIQEPTHLNGTKQPIKFDFTSPTSTWMHDVGEKLKTTHHTYKEENLTAQRNPVKKRKREDYETDNDETYQHEEDPEDDEAMNEKWHMGGGNPEYLIKQEDLDNGYQLARSPNKNTGPKSYKTKNYGEFKDVTYKTDSNGSIDFESPVSTKTWQAPVRPNTLVKLNDGSKDKKFGFTKSKTKVMIPGASREQHFSIADRILEKKGVKINRSDSYTWHHLTKPYEMVLVDMTVHAKHGHEDAGSPPGFTVAGECTLAIHWQHGRTTNADRQDEPNIY